MTTKIKWMIILGALFFVGGMVGLALSMMFGTTGVTPSSLGDPRQFGEATGGELWWPVITALTAAAGLTVLLLGISRWIRNRRLRREREEQQQLPEGEEGKDPTATIAQ